MIVKLVVLDRIDEAEGQRSACVFGQLEQTGDRLAPSKEGSVAESLVRAFLRKTVCVDNRRAVAGQVRRQAPRKRQPLARVVSEEDVIHGAAQLFQRAHDGRQRNLVPVSHLELGLLGCQKSWTSFRDLEYPVTLDQTAPWDWRSYDKLPNRHFVIQDQGYELISP